MTDKRKLGKKGEKFTVKFLKRNKYKILLRNFSVHGGEIDIIARNKKYIVFVEVKTRTDDYGVPTRFSVDYKKQRNIINTSEIFLRKYDTNLIRRYDISEVSFNPKGKMEINYLKNAFIKEDLDIYK